MANWAAYSCGFRANKGDAPIRKGFFSKSSGEDIVGKDASGGRDKGEDVGGRETRLLKLVAGLLPEAARLKLLAAASLKLLLLVTVGELVIEVGIIFSLLSGFSRLSS